MRDAKFISNLAQVTFRPGLILHNRSATDDFQVSDPGEVTIITTILSVLACFGFASQMQAVSPAPNGCYFGLTTAEGCDALSLLTGGKANTASGWHSLFSAGDANFNTGVGAGALALTTTGADSNTAVGTAAMLLNTSGFINAAVGTGASL